MCVIVSVHAGVGRRAAFFASNGCFSTSSPILGRSDLQLGVAATRNGHAPKCKVQPSDQRTVQDPSTSIVTGIPAESDPIDPCQ